jgi:hypothetical protein
MAPGSSGVSPMEHTSTGPGMIFRFINAVVLVGFSFALLGWHWGQVHTPHETRAICTASNTPADCWTYGGHFRGAEFTAPTTTISFNSYDVGTFAGPDGVARPVGAEPYAVVYANGVTDEHRQHWCTTQLDLAERSKAACHLEKIPEMWEVPNALLARASWTFSGGVHIWYFIWLSTWLSASFAVAMLPSVVDMIKLPVLAAWHLVGLMLTVMMFVDDPYFQVRLPLNNVIIGVVLEVFSIAAQFYWARQSQEEWAPTLLKAAAYAPLPAGLAGLMSLGDGSVAGGSVTGSTHSHHSHPPPVEVKPKMWHLSFEVFNSKLQEIELLEALFVEMTLTVPLLLIAVFCIASRVNLDWVIASLFLRAFFLFVCMAICFKSMKFVANRERRDTASANKYDMWLVMVVFILTLLFLAVYFIMDWYYPMKEADTLWGDALESSIPALVYITLTALCLLLVAFLVVLLLAAYTISWTNDEEEDVKSKLRTVQVYFFYGAQFGLLVLRTTAFAYGVDPFTWYGSWTRSDVPLNYP